MFRAIAVTALPGFRLWLRYADGVEGEVDLAHLAGRGVFKLWDEKGKFEKVHLGSGSAVAWNEDVEVCADALYLRIKDPASRADCGRSRRSHGL